MKVSVAMLQTARLKGLIMCEIRDFNSTYFCAGPKSTHWDRMTPEGVRRNVTRQARQVWSYVESQLANGEEVSHTPKWQKPTFTRKSNANVSQS